MSVDFFQIDIKPTIQTEFTLKPRAEDTLLGIAHMHDGVTRYFTTQSDIEKEAEIIRVESEADIIREWLKFATETHAMVLCGHYIKKFDLVFLRAHFAEDVEPYLKSVKISDTWKIAKWMRDDSVHQHHRIMSLDLNEVARALGVKGRVNAKKTNVLNIVKDVYYKLCELLCE
jgi:DNA polymerase elongation subunit (family B)